MTLRMCLGALLVFLLNGAVGVQADAEKQSETVTLYYTGNTRATLRPCPS